VRRWTRTGVLLAAAVLVAWVNAHLAARRAAGGDVLRVCFSPEPPFAFIDEAGEFTGTEVELLRSLVASQGIRLEPVAKPFDKLISAVRGGECNVIASGLFVLPSRCRLVNFSEPTILVRRGLMIAHAGKAHPGSYKSVADSGLRLAVVSGGVSERSALDAGVSPDQLVILANLGDAVEEVERGRADVVAGSMPALEKLFAHALVVPL